MVNNGEDCVVALTLRESHNQVHCYLCKWGCIFWDWDFEKGYLWSMSQVLVLLTGGAPLDILVDALLGFWP